jgi:hypothetical protein
MRSLQTGGDGKNTREGAVGVVREVSLAAFALADGTRSGAALYSTYLQRHVSLACTRQYISHMLQITNLPADTALALPRE